MGREQQVIVDVFIWLWENLEWSVYMSHTSNLVLVSSNLLAPTLSVHLRENVTIFWCHDPTISIILTLDHTGLPENERSVPNQSTANFFLKLLTSQERKCYIKSPEFRDTVGPSARLLACLLVCLYVYLPGYRVPLSTRWEIRTRNFSNFPDRYVSRCYFCLRE